MVCCVSGETASQTDPIFQLLKYEISLLFATADRSNKMLCKTGNPVSHMLNRQIAIYIHFTIMDQPLKHKNDPFGPKMSVSQDI